MKRWIIGIALIVSGIALSDSFNGGGGGGGGTTVTVAAPYVTIAGTKYIAATMWPFSAFPSLSALDSVTCTNTGGANGSEVSSCALNANNAWYSAAATTSAEAEFSLAGGNSGISSVTITGGIWLCDSTNNKIYELELVQAPGGGGNWNYIQLVSWTETACAGTPASSSVLGQFPISSNGIIHLKIAKVSSNIVSSISFAAADDYIQLDSRAVGTISKGGFAARTPTATTTVVLTWLTLALT